MCKTLKSNSNPVNIKKLKKQNKPWFDKNCQSRRIDYIKVKNKLKKIKNVVSQTELKLKATEYKKIIKKTLKTYNKELHKKLRNLKVTKPRDYWDILNRASNHNEKLGNIALQTFMDHFKNLNTKTQGDEVK